MQYLWMFTVCSKKSLTGQENLAASSTSSASGMSAADLDSLKQELMAEVRREIQQAKQEIIDGRLHVHVHLKPSSDTREFIAVYLFKCVVYCCSYQAGAQSKVTGACVTLQQAPASQNNHPPL